jgi:hypothetical protein
VLLHPFSESTLQNHFIVTRCLAVARALFMLPCATVVEAASTSAIVDYSLPSRLSSSDISGDEMF